MRRKGFTLIEVLVVLSVLALVAVLAYTMLGGVLAESKAKSAAAQIHKDLREVGDAIATWMNGSGTFWYKDISLSRDVARHFGSNRSKLLDAGLIAADPKPRQEWKDGACPSSMAYQYPSDASWGYMYLDPDLPSSVSANSTTFGAAYLAMRCVTDEICTQFNAQGPLGQATIPSWTGSWAAAPFNSGALPVPVCLKANSTFNLIAYKL